MKVAVTGATGFIGRRVARMLRDDGHEVVCLVRSPDRAQALAALGCTLAQGDILDRPSLDRAFAGADAVIHMAASYEMGVVGAKKELARRQNLDGTRLTLEAAHAAGARRIIYTSSVVIYGDGREHGGAAIPEGAPLGAHPPTFYSWSKAEAHKIALEQIARGAPIIILQPGAVFGDDDVSIYSLIWQFVARGLPAPVGDTIIATVDVDDCARAHVLALTRGAIGASYHLVGENLALADMARRAAAAAQMRVRPWVLPSALFKISAALASIVERVIPVPRLFSGDTLRGQSGLRLAVDDARARAELGVTPRNLDDTFRTIMRAQLARRGAPLPPSLRG